MSDDLLLIGHPPPLPEKQRELFKTRLARLETMAESVRKSTKAMAELASTPSFTVVQIRTPFVRRKDPAPGDASDRKLPKPEHRPPATRLISPRGAALRLYLTALFEAQAVTRTRPGTHPKNSRPLEAVEGISWSDLLASPAKPSAYGTKYYKTPRDKKLRQLKTAIGRLAEERLVSLPNEQAPSGRLEGFVLMHEGGPRWQGEDAPYTLPKPSEPDLFAVPAALFTSGWIHVLEDSELAFLLMLASRGPIATEIMFTSQERVLHYGLGPDAYEAHQLLSRLDLVDVKVDPNRVANGLVQGFITQGTDAMPHQFRLLPQGFEVNAFEALRTELTRQINR